MVGRSELKVSRIVQQVPGRDPITDFLARIELPAHPAISGPSGGPIAYAYRSDGYCTDTFEKLSDGNWWSISHGAGKWNPTGPVSRSMLTAFEIDAVPEFPAKYLEPVTEAFMSGGWHKKVCRYDITKRLFLGA